jgi:hypothetical protein
VFIRGARDTIKRKHSDRSMKSSKIRTVRGGIEIVILKRTFRCRQFLRGFHGKRFV